MKLSKTYPEIKSVASRCFFALKKCIKDSKGDKKSFLKLCYVRIDHYCGIHSNCHTWKKTSCDMNIGIFDPSAQQAFMVSVTHCFFLIFVYFVSVGSMAGILASLSQV
jgi:hypothetical protein